MRVLCDTNILIEHLNDQGQWYALMEAIGSGSVTGLISIISQYELFSFPGMTAEEEGAAGFLLQAFSIQSLDHRIVTRAALLRRRYKRKPLDLFIAATALELDVPLLTKNLQDFRSIEGLNVSSTPDRFLE